MGFSGISPWSLLLILVIVLLLFGTKRLRNVGGDLGGAIKNFKKSMAETDKEEAKKQQVAHDEGQVIDSEATTKEKDKA